MMPAIKSILSVLLSTSLLHAQAEDDAVESFNDDLLPETPNVILIIADGLGSQLLHSTAPDSTAAPNIAKLAQQSIRWDNFYLAPKDSLTRASLFTGRYNPRTKVLDSSHGVASMANDEITLAEVLSGNGYVTGLFGTWGLGDNYPSRASDQGFQTTLTHRGSNFNALSPIASNKALILLNNNYEKRFEESINDVIFDSAEEFIRRAKNHHIPFFATISACNEATTPAEQTAHLADFDKKIGQLTKLLKSEEAEQNTIIILVSDSGSQFADPSSSLKGHAGSMYEGGLRSTLLISWPEKIKQAQAFTSNIAAHIDVMPTLLDACGYGVEEAFGFDGISLLPQLESPSTALPERTIFQQWHRGETLNKEQHFMIRKGDWKLINPAEGYSSNSAQSKLELYNLSADPNEQQNLIEGNSEKATELLSDYKKLFSNVTETRLRDAAPSYIFVNRAEENPLVLTWQSRLAKDWGFEHPGFWKLQFEHDGRADVSVEFPADFKTNLEGWTAELSIGKQTYKQEIHAGEHHYTFSGIDFKKGRRHLRCKFTSPDGAHVVSAYQVRLQHR